MKQPTPPPMAVNNTSGIGLEKITPVVITPTAAPPAVKGRRKGRPLILPAIKPITAPITVGISDKAAPLPALSRP